MNILSTLRRWRAQLYLAAGRLPPGWEDRTNDWRRARFRHESGWVVAPSKRWFYRSGAAAFPVWEIREPPIDGDGAVHVGAVAHRPTYDAAIVFVEGVR